MKKFEPFIVKHYVGEERPSIKGNGFDGLEIGKNRDEAELFVAFVNELERQQDDLKRAWEALDKRQAIRNVFRRRSDDTLEALQIMRVDQTSEGFQVIVC